MSHPVNPIIVPHTNSQLEILGTNWWEILNTHNSVDTSLIMLENSMAKDLFLNTYRDLLLNIYSTI